MSLRANEGRAQRRHDSYADRHPIGHDAPLETVRPAAHYAPPDAVSLLRCRGRRRHSLRAREYTDRGPKRKCPQRSDVACETPSLLRQLQRQMKGAFRRLNKAIQSGTADFDWGIGRARGRRVIRLNCSGEYRTAAGTSFSRKTLVDVAAAHTGGPHGGGFDAPDWEHAPA